MSDYLLDGGIMSIPDFYNSLNPTEQELFNRYKINHTDDDPAFTYDLNRYLRSQPLPTISTATFEPHLGLRSIRQQLPDSTRS